MTRLQEHVLNM